MYKLRISYFLILFASLLLINCASNHRASRHTRLNYAYKYKGRLLSAKQQCDRAMKKKYKPKKKLFAGKPDLSKNYSLAERGPGESPAPKPAPKPRPTPQPAQTNSEEQVTDRLKGESFEDLSLDQKHDIEDDVLRENDIPAPTSQEHERIRKEVEDRIKNEDFPQDLEPLYFIHDDDEFSVVDMEPFLVAVEYALQGRMILIEGHTDASGRDDYNVQLSIQRVEKIRQLMHDMGVPDERISVIGYGEEKASSQTEVDEKSRRVDFKVF